MYFTLFFLGCMKFISSYIFSFLTIKIHVIGLFHKQYYLFEENYYCPSLLETETDTSKSHRNHVDLFIYKCIKNYFIIEYWPFEHRRDTHTNTKKRHTARSKTKCFRIERVCLENVWLNEKQCEFVRSVLNGCVHSLWLIFSFICMNKTEYYRNIAAKM